MENMYTSWDFVEKFYPNYSSSNEIASNGELLKLIEQDDIEEGDCADKLLKSTYNNDLYNPEIKKDYDESLIIIYETAIENFLKTNSIAS